MKFHPRRAALALASCIFGCAVMAPCLANPSNTNEEMAASFFLEDNTPFTPGQLKGLEAAKKGRALQSVSPITTPDGVVRFPYGVSTPLVVCAVLQVCTIELQPGEDLVGDPVIGDPRFDLVPVLSGSPQGDVISIAVKPLDVGLKTTLVVATTKRRYHVELRSHLTDYMSRVGFFYPDEQRARMQEARQKVALDRKKQELPATGEYLGDLDFNYRIEGDESFRPLRVYNDGTRTILQLPKAVTREEAPIFMVLEGGSWFSDPQEVLPNYRIHGDRYIVDGLFQRGALSSGVGGAKRSVIITRGAQ